MHQVLQYLKNSSGQGLLFPAYSNTYVTTFVGSIWGNCKVTRKSTTDLCVYLGSSLVSWKSKKKPIVAHSLAEAEYRALASLTSEPLWLQQLLRPFQIKVDSIMMICNNKSAIKLAENPNSYEIAKLIDIDIVTSLDNMLPRVYSSSFIYLLINNWMTSSQRHHLSVNFQFLCPI